MNNVLKLLVLQSTSFCNINCDYCYLPDRSRANRMDVATVARTLERVFESPVAGSEFTIVWHAGEPLTVPASFYAAAFQITADVQAQFGRTDCKVTHNIQTNAMLINEAWCDLFLRYDVKVGVSLDGPAFIHDRHRVTRAGLGTHIAPRP